MDFTTFEIIVCVTLVAFAFGVARGIDSLEKIMSRNNQLVMVLEQHLQDINSNVHEISLRIDYIEMQMKIKKD